MQSYSTTGNTLCVIVLLWGELPVISFMNNCQIEQFVAQHTAIIFLISIFVMFPVSKTLVDYLEEKKTLINLFSIYPIGK